MTQPRLRIIGFAALAVAIGIWLAVQQVYFERGVIPGDAYNYLAAGERLNAGHPLYALSPGDRWVDIKPPYWTVPLVSPPPIAVLFRGFALYPYGGGAYVWWFMQVATLITSLVMLARRVPPLLMAAAILVLVIPSVYEVGVGNLNSFLLLGLILTWRYVAEGRERSAGAVAAVMTAVKLTPAMAVWWLLVTGRRRAVGAAIVTGAIVLAISLLGAGVAAHVDYLRILTSAGAIGTSPLSLGGMARFIGVPDAIADKLPDLAIVAGLVAVALLRRRPAAGFIVAVLTMIYGSPAVSINWYVLLYAVLAPVAWPLSDRAREAVQAPVPADPVPGAAS